MLSRFTCLFNLMPIAAERMPLAILLVLLLLVQQNAAQPALNVWSINGPNADVRKIVVDPINPAIIYAGTGNVYPQSGLGIFKSINNGASWSAYNQGLGNLTINSLAIDPSNPNILCAGTRGGVFKTANGGANWYWVSFPASFVYSLAIAPSNPNIIYAGNQYGLYVSTDGGGSWNTRPSPDQMAAFNLIAVDPQNPNVIYTAFDFYEDYFSTLYKSIDGGSSWTRLDYINTGGLITHALKINSSDSNIIYGATFAGVYKSTNGGKNWMFRSSPGLNGVVALAVDPVNKTNLYAASFDTGVYKSTDDGATWSAFNNGLTNFQVNDLAFDASGRFLHAATSTGVFSVRVREDVSNNVIISGRITTPDGRGLRSATVWIIDPQGATRAVTTGSFGFYSFENVAAGQTYMINVSSRLYRFASRSLLANDNLTNVDFVGLE